jgi:hypothetical protein
METNSEGAEDGKEERSQDFERNFKNSVGEEERGEWVCAILVLVVEDLYRLVRCSVRRLIR